VRSPLVGRPNAYNILAASAAAMALDVPFSAIETGVSHLEHVPGRFQVVSEPTDDLRVIVDYAHTDDALKNLLETARPLATGRLVTVFGCGGDRDRTKRAPMGEIAATLSDVAIVTSDNPRSEAPLAIIADVEVGLQKAGREYVKLPDRREAIFCAINEARDGDVVVIAGKGHETYQILGDNTIHFDDKEVAREAMTERRGASR
jgi:UDP-N-acetylmuramyl-tripeptide synthetase